MTEAWAPSRLGGYLTGSSNWQLRLNGPELWLSVAGRIHTTRIEDETSYRLDPGVFWTDFTLFPGRPDAVRVDGLPNAQGIALGKALKSALADQRILEDVAYIQRAHQSMREWLDQKQVQEDVVRAERRWFTHEMQTALENARPEMDVPAVRARLKRSEVQARLGNEVAAVNGALAHWEADHRANWELLNARHTESELEECKDLFARVESKPLTDEQARAVVCFDNRVQVVASAGSGKTSTMVAKAAYAIHRDLVAPERIVMLAFNKQAAEELSARAANAFERLGMQGVQVNASTFHALGLSIIGKATGEKPDVPDWATDAIGGIRKLGGIIDQLKDRDPAFRTRWDLFRFVFGKDLPAFGSIGTPDVWDGQGNGRTLTADGKRVRSQEEATISNWLFYNGVDYRYEDSYRFKTATDEYRQYRPDFYYPAIDLYHEHFALDAQGNAPPSFGDYVSGVAWKRQLHRERGTSLIETTSHQIRTGAVFDHLAQELTRRGTVLDPNPDREIPRDGQKPMEQKELIKLVRTFISHVKSNCLPMAALHSGLDAMPDGTFKYRHRMFLDIVAPILREWDAALASEGGIDFEDMLNQAADHLENGRYSAPYELVMADEFQDASRARARLCRALVRKPGRFFFAVGDDWQSINRFAGADVSVMTAFREWFEHGQILKLEQTFRCPQALCDVSSQFVAKNPAQLSKLVRSATPAVGPVLQAFQVDHKDELTDAIDQFVQHLAEGVNNGTIPPGRDGKVSVYVLGRYNADRNHLPSRMGRFSRWVNISFLTIHKSKGSEADYVILPEMRSVLRGRSFPNTRADDPVLALAMPAGDAFYLSEERRLFYVALTRARRGVAMFTTRGQCSSFLRELEADGAVKITNMKGEPSQEERCPWCKQGVLVARTGRYGEFRSCSNYPACAYKPKSGRTEPDVEVPIVESKDMPGAISTVPAKAASRRLTFSDVLNAPSRGPGEQRASVGRPAPPAGSATRPASRIKDTHEADPVVRASLGRRIAGGLRAVNEGVAAINHSLDRASALQRATFELELDLYAERLMLDTGLERARSAMALEEKLKDANFRKIYEQTHERLSLLLVSTDEARPAKPAVDRALPSFERRDRHDDPEIDNAIQKKIEGLREGQAALLSRVRVELSADPALCAHFMKLLETRHVSHYREILDPASYSSLA